MKKRQSGFTLLEMLFSFLIFSIICLVIFAVYELGLNSWDLILGQAHLSGDVRTGIERMSKELRMSTLSNVDSSSATQLRFKVPASVDQTTGVITSWSDWIRFSRGGTGGNQLLRTDESSGVVTVLANNVTDLQFAANANPSTISIDMTAEKTTAKNTLVPVHLSTSVELRN